MAKFTGKDEVLTTGAPEVIPERVCGLDGCDTVYRPESVKQSPVCDQCFHAAGRNTPCSWGHFSVEMCSCPQDSPIRIREARERADRRTKFKPRRRNRRDPYDWSFN